MAKEKFVYLVQGFDYDYQPIDSIWDTEEKANARRDELNSKKSDVKWSTDPYLLNEPEGVAG